MNHIIELPEVLANQIAAGEVIERPASVVKELVENALDAGASTVQVSIEDSGLKLIEVADDGHGIARDDLPLSLKRHATSKIKSQADLFRIRTLGFRGEALPSIASVSRLVIETATQNEESGNRLSCQGGKDLEMDRLSRPVGTKISVQDLFYNTPARLKYLKSQAAELAHIVDVMNRMSLAHPEVTFRLFNDGKLVLESSGRGDLRQAIAAVYGIANARKMVAIQGQNLDFRLTGFVSLPELTRANRNYISIFINGRYIKNFLLNRAILDGYGSKLMVGRFPLAVLSIEIDPHLADVNVHPTKQEVRISKERELMTLITEAIIQALNQQVLIPEPLENLAKSTSQKAQKIQQTQLDLKEKAQSYNVASPSTLPSSLEIPETGGEEQSSLPKDEQASLITDKYTRLAQRPTLVDQDLDHPAMTGSSLTKALRQLEQEQTSSFPHLEYFGQMHGTYLFAQGKEGLFIIDQHAAQERVKYEYYREKIGQVDSSQQGLLVPILFDFPASDSIRLLQKLPLLEQVGIHLEPYGSQQFILREHPIWMKEEEIESAVYELCDMLLLTNQVSIKEYRAELAIMMSCKRSIKANHALDDYSARHLLNQLAQCKNPYNCPHGRPVLVHFSPSDMEKMFRRIQENHTSLRELGKY